MIENFFEHPYTLRFLRAGTTGPHIEAFAAALVASQYSRNAGRAALRGVAHLGHWMEANGLALASLDETMLSSFFDHIPTCHCVRRHKGQLPYCVAAGRQFLAWGRANGIVATAPPAPDVPRLIEEYEAWMRHHRNVAPITLKDVHRRPLCRFLEYVGDDPAKFDAKGIRGFVLAEAQRISPRAAKSSATALRQLLRFLSVMDRCRPELVDAVPTIANWRLSTLPTFISPAEIDRILAACDVSTAKGCQDRAMLLLMARLGLRAGDVAALRIGDINWAAATVTVFGKSRRRARLPLPQDVGDAILAWLEMWRPVVHDDHVFVRLRAPIGPFVDGQAVSTRAARAARRAGVVLPRAGSHVLRHSAATTLLDEGMSLPAIGALLRHGSLETTSIYAKVDVGLLTTVARSWPSEVSS
jgi:site-specific recombinase XerD